MKRNYLWRLLLTLPVLLVPLATYIAVEGRIKFPWLIFLTPFVVLLECIAVFFYRCVVRFWEWRRNKP